MNIYLSSCFRLGDSETDTDGGSGSSDRAAFVQELLLSTLCDLSLSPGALEDGNILPTSLAKRGGGMSRDVGTSKGDSDKASKAVVSSDVATQTSSGTQPLTSTATTTTTQTNTQHQTMPQSKTPNTMKSVKGAKGVVVGRSSPGSQQHQQQQQSNGGGVVSRPLTGTGTVAVSPVGGPGRGRASGGSVSPGTARRKLVRGVEGRTTEPPPPH